MRELTSLQRHLDVKKTSVWVISLYDLSLAPFTVITVITAMTIHQLGSALASDRPVLMNPDQSGRTLIFICT